MKNLYLLEEMRNSCLFCCVIILADYNYTWTIKVKDADCEEHEETLLYDGVLDLDKAIKKAHTRCKKLFPKFKSYASKKKRLRDKET